METSLLGLYVKLNVLLAAALLMWLATKGLARHLRFETSHAMQLTVARVLFASFLGMAAIAFFAHGWLTAFATRMTDGVAVVASIEGGLEYHYGYGAVGVDGTTIVLLLLFAGFAWQAARLARQVGTLRAIVNGAVEWRCVGRIHLLASPAIATPFSTRALGRKHIVLPMSLLESPRNLRLAVKHELQHVRNGDLEWVLMIEAVKALCFWNPAAWLWHNEFNCLQEFACDEALVTRRHVTPQAYGTCLLEVACAHGGNVLLATSNMVPTFSWWQDTQTQLKRRIVMLTRSRSARYPFAKAFVYTLLAGAGMTQAALVVFAADVAPAAEIVPLVRVNPEYPQEALTTNMGGWVQLEFTITETGAVADAVVVDAGVCPNGQGREACRSDDLFAASALTAIGQWRYAPPTVNGQAVSKAGVQTIMRYALDNAEAAAQ